MEAASSSAAIGARRSTPWLVLESMRPAHWTKNAFVLAALVFSGQVLEPLAQLRAWTATIAFCLASGAAYLLNDSFDAAVDSHNPRTAARPIARGDLPVATARVWAAIVSVAALGLAVAVNWETLAVLGGFVVLQAAYSLKLKHLLFIDVIVVASGFVLRALGGLEAVQVEISEWLLLCTGLLALFLALAKRRGEVVALGGASHPRRPVLEGCSLTLLDELIAVVTPAILVGYALYAVTGAQAGSIMLVTLPFVLYGIFRVLLLIHHRSALTEDPAVVVWKDRALLACVVLWGITAAIVSALAN